MAPHMPIDALVVGGGPAGLYAAWRLAQSGFAVVLCEEHEQIGHPAHCTGVVSAGSFDEFKLPRETILNPLHTVRFVSPSNLEVRYSPPSLEAVVIDRPAFDRRLAAQAVALGADVRLSTRVSRLDFMRTGVRVLTTAGALDARLVILATGAAYRLQRSVGLGVPRTYLHTAQRELSATTLGDVEIHFGGQVAPGGFAWAVPVDRPEGPRVRVGVMATHRAPGWYDAMVNRLAPRWGIRRTAGDRPRLKFLPLRALQRTYGDRLLVIGDAAGLVKPTTGGGIYYSVLSAALAADVAERALKIDGLQASALRPYQTRWRRRLAGEFHAQMALRQLAQRMSDRQIDSLFELALIDGVMPIVSRTAKFNHHKPLIHALLRHTPARRIFWPTRP